MTVFTSKFPAEEIPEVPLFEHVLAQCDVFADKVAIVDGISGFQLTFKQVKQYTQLVAVNLQRKFGFGVDASAPAPVLAIHLPNHPLYPVIFHGVNMAGGVNTTLNPLYTPLEIAKQLQDSGASLFITADLFLDKVLEAVKDLKQQVKTIFVMSTNPVEAREVDGVQIVDAKILLSPPKSAEEAALLRVRKINPKEDVVVLPYSSGTTGLNKGVMLTHYNIVSNCICTRRLEPVSSDDMLLGLLPFFHIYAMLIVNCLGISRGATIVTMPRFDLQQFLEIVQKHRITRAHLVPPILLALAKHPLVANYDLSSIKVIVSGAAPLSKELQGMVKARLPNIVVKQGYGMTEASPVVAVEPDDDVVTGSSGVLIPNVEARIVDVATGEAVGHGKEGELQVRGPNVMKGYLNNEEANRITLVDGWLRTGDVAVVHENGHIFIVDRVKELIKFKGFQVAPAELEGLLLKLDGVADAAVVGLPDDEAGELPAAFVVRKPDAKLTAEDIHAYIDDKVAHYKRIRNVQFIDAIPKATSGKILRRVLKQQAISQGQQKSA